MGKRLGVRILCSAVLAAVAVLAALPSVASGAEVEKKVGAVRKREDKNLEGSRNLFKSIPFFLLNTMLDLIGWLSFTLNLDEEGNTGFMTPEQAGWLRARAVAEDANNATLDPLSQRMLGLELLLRELVPTSVDGEE